MEAHGAVGGVERGCGKRVEGGLYAECGMSKYGRPVEDFLVCPPKSLDLAMLGVEPLGVRLFKFPDGTWHVIDWVGSMHYSYVTDFIEEVRRFGVSRKWSPGLDLSVLTKDSRMIFVHATAMIRNPEALRKERVGGRNMGYDWHDCPKYKRHDDGESCLGLCWENVHDVMEFGPPWDPRIGNRKMPSFRYVAACPPEERIAYEPAVFAIFPITRLAVVKAKDGSHEETYQQVRRRSRLPVVTVDN